MPTLYTHADSNIRRTWLYMGFFLVFVILICWLVSEYFGSYIVLYIGIAYSVSASFFGYWYSDKIVLKMTGAKPIEKKDNPELYRTVENLCITAGLPLPKIYILQESQPNAFATGRDPRHSAVAVTQGLLQKLDRNELEGVISHELSHIGNRDALLQTVIVVLVGVVAVLSNILLRMGRFGGRRDSRNGGSVIFLIFLIAAAILAPLAANLIKLAISRKREFLADASGALLTRYPEGLASALEKISQDNAPLRTSNPSTAHLFIASPFKGREQGGFWVKIFSTHPPVAERIKALRAMEAR